MRCKAYFDILNRLGVTHECKWKNGQMDGRMDGETDMPRFTLFRCQAYTQTLVCILHNCAQCSRQCSI